jgi:membrane associated rhomboid family serine protease
MFPISDDNPSNLTPFVTWSLIGACALVFLVQFSMSQQEAQAAIYSFGMIPARVFDKAELRPELAVVPAWATVITSMFMHAGLLHLAGNMLFLWIFGDNVEDAMGHVRFLVFYIACGVAAAMTQGLLSPDSTVPMVGASGAISGVLGAYLLLHPQATVRVLVFFGFFATVVHVPSILALGLWFLGQLLNAASQPVDQPGVAFWAHIGGFVAGMVLVPMFKRPGTPLLQPRHSRPFDVERRRGPWG